MAIPFLLLTDAKVLDYSAHSAAAPFTLRVEVPG